MTMTRQTSSRPIERINSLLGVIEVIRFDKASPLQYVQVSPLGMYAKYAGQVYLKTDYKRTDFTKYQKSLDPVKMFQDERLLFQLCVDILKPGC